MGRPRTIDVEGETERVRAAALEVTDLPLKGWQKGWSVEQMAEAQCWLEFARAQARRMLSRLARVERDRRLRALCVACHKNAKNGEKFPKCGRSFHRHMCAPCHAASVLTSKEECRG
jgi:hypothetical protein